MSLGVSGGFLESARENEASVLHREVDSLREQCKKQRDYIIHLLRKQEAVMGLNEQDIAWLTSFGIKVIKPGESDGNS